MQAWLSLRRARRWMLRGLWAVLLGAMVACGSGGSSSSSASTPSASGGGSTGAGATSASGSDTTSGTASLSPVTLEVTAATSAAPLDVPRTVNVPPGFGLRVLARVPAARFLLVTPNGDILVSLPSTGQILLLRADGNGGMTSSVFASGLTQPQDMVLVTLAGQQWLYVAESNQVSRALYQAGDSAIEARTVVVGGLPDNSTPELRGAYAHALKNIAVSASGSLYVSIASSCNACVEDDQATPVRGAIYRYDADGGNGRLFARGLRNAEGLDFVPGTERLWVAVNNRDDIAYPFDQDLDGDGVSDLGKVIPAYVEHEPPEPVTEVVDGGRYGWPYCNAQSNATLHDLSSIADVLLNPGSSVYDCTSVSPIQRGLPAHSAPLGFAFMQASGLPAPLNAGAMIAMHGCWNCTSAIGYKVAVMGFDDQGQPTDPQDVVTGFAPTTSISDVWGRPVDVAAWSGHGSLLISDDYAGAIYELYPLQ